MNRPAFVFLLWGLELGALAVVGAAVFGFEGAESPLLLGGAALTFVALAGFIAARRLGSAEAPHVEAVPDVSPATAWLGVSLVLLALSIELGLWLALIAAGMAGAGAAGLGRELLAQRRLAERVRSEGGER